MSLDHKADSAAEGEEEAIAALTAVSRRAENYLTRVGKPIPPEVSKLLIDAFAVGVSAANERRIALRDLADERAEQELAAVSAAAMTHVEAAAAALSSIGNGRARTEAGSRAIEAIRKVVAPVGCELGIRPFCASREDLVDARGRALVVAQALMAELDSMARLNADAARDARAAVLVTIAPALFGGAR